MIVQTVACDFRFLSKKNSLKSSHSQMKGSLALVALTAGLTVVQMPAV